MEETITSKAGERNIKHVVAVMSGKGGLGKSLITSMLAVALRRQGFDVGVLDGDITCPGIVDLFGAENRYSLTDNGEIEPLESKSGIKIISMSMFAENESEPLVWRGPMVSSAFKQLYNDSDWGQLDYLLVDVPSGTSDVPMTVLQTLPLDGIIIVSSPQILSMKVVKKCINMVFQLGGSIIGIVENMSHFIARGGEYYEVFGPSRVAELVHMTGAPLLAQMPIDPKLAALCDTSRVEEYDAEVIHSLAINFLNRLSASAGGR